MYDLIVIGAGPAGLTAAIYARRADKSVLIIEKSTFVHYNYCISLRIIFARLFHPSIQRL